VFELFPKYASEFFETVPKEISEGKVKCVLPSMHFWPLLTAA
jgi:hypothetical protein